MNEPVFAQAFNIAEVANFSKQQREDYEKSRLSYIGIKQVTETAEKDGLKKGREEGKIEKEIEAVLGFSKNGVPISIIAKSLNLTENRVNEIIQSEK